MYKTTMNRTLSTEEHIFRLQKWWNHDHDYSEVCDLFVNRLPTAPPSRKAIHNLNKRFEQSGTVADLPRPGRPKSVVAEQNENIVAQSFVQSPTESTQKASNDLGIPRTNLQRILKEYG